MSKQIEPRFKILWRINYKECEPWRELAENIVAFVQHCSLIAECIEWELPVVLSHACRWKDNTLFTNACLRGERLYEQGQSRSMKNRILDKHTDYRYKYVSKTVWAGTWQNFKWIDEDFTTWTTHWINFIPVTVNQRDQYPERYENLREHQHPSVCLVMPFWLLNSRLESCNSNESLNYELSTFGN
jgi:hypothetical protein